MDSRSPVNPDPRSRLPGVDPLARQICGLEPELPRWAATAAARDEIAEARKKISEAELAPAGIELWLESLPERARDRAIEFARIRPRPVINATGVVLHTNLGRAPLAEGAARAAAAAAAGYSDLELDLGTGRRGQRLGQLGSKLALLAGTPAATVVNNNAAAVLLALNTLARGREVIVSRGELVEIGGSFRVPDIMERAGVRLVEVGTTNRTHARDYENAIGPDTALLLKVHRSNFAQTGFVKEVGLGELVEIGRLHGLTVVEDLGSGKLVDVPSHGLPLEAHAPSRAALGADIVCFSGDKLLGGPQAGLLIGGADVVAQLRSNPLARALRLDKMSIAALDWTLSALLDGREREIPVVAQLLEEPAAIAIRAERLAEVLRRVAKERAEIVVETDRAPVGGGSLPGFMLDTSAVVLRGTTLSADALASALREAPTPVVARVRDDAVLLDLRTLREADTAAVEDSLRRALA
jgi:L-seryl-tRNA(Ser) seleniumtransferase